MERAAKSKNMLKFLSEASSAVSFQNPPFSPSRVDKRFAHAGKGFSGHIVSIIPDEARRKKKNDASFDTQEPTSPKVSCMGQIKHSNKIPKTKRQNSMPVSIPDRVKPKPVWSPRAVKKHAAVFRRIFAGSQKTGTLKSGKHDGGFADDVDNKQPPVNRAPCLGQLKRFASGRDTFANFDWSVQVTPVDSELNRHRNYYSDDEEIDIQFSAPVFGAAGGGGGMCLQPRKEVNLWKRRTMAEPIPLQLHKP